VLEGSIAEHVTVALRQLRERVRRSVLELLGRERHDVTALLLIVVELAPGHARGRYSANNVRSFVIAN
jgi:hypothetical protein